MPKRSPANGTTGETRTVPAESPPREKSDRAATFHSDLEFQFFQRRQTKPAPLLCLLLAADGSHAAFGGSWCSFDRRKRRRPGNSNRHISRYHHDHPGVACWTSCATHITAVVRLVQVAAVPTSAAWLAHAIVEHRRLRNRRNSRLIHLPCWNIGIAITKLSRVRRLIHHWSRTGKRS